MVTDIDTTLAALADPTRRRIVELLRDRPRRAGEIAAEFDVTGPAVSRHLRVLRRSGLIEEHGVDDDARVRVYRLRPERLAGLRAWVDQVEAFWADQLGAFREHIERDDGVRGDLPARPVDPLHRGGVGGPGVPGSGGGQSSTGIS